MKAPKTKTIRYDSSYTTIEKYITILIDRL